MSLALITIVYEWRRYFAAIIALALSGLLVLIQVGLFVGIGQAFTSSIDRSRGDLFILNANAASLFGSVTMPVRVRPMVHLHPAVHAVRDMPADGSLWQNQPRGGQTKVREWVQAYGMDLDETSITLPQGFPEQARLKLMEPNTVAVDRTALKRLGIEEGQYGVLANRGVRVVAVLDGYANVSQPMIYMSRQTMAGLGLGTPSHSSGPLVVKLAPGADPDLVSGQLNQAGSGAYRAWTKGELSQASQWVLFEEQVVGIFLIFSLVIAVIVGVGITTQTLQGAVQANIHEFAALRASGVSIGSLRLVVMELSFWVGVAGVTLAGGLTLAFGTLGSKLGIPMAFPGAVCAGVASLMVVTAAVSGLMSLGALQRSDPASLLP